MSEELEERIEEEAPGIDEGELYGDEPPDLEGEEDPYENEPEEDDEPPMPSTTLGEPAGESGSLFPGMEVPEGIEKLARAMKKAEIARKEQQAIEKDKRDELCALMDHMDCRRFQIDIDGIDYEFELDSKIKVKSKKLAQEDE